MKDQNAEQMKDENAEVQANDPAWNRYHKQFYGTDIPASMRQKIAKPFSDMVEMMSDDLKEVHYDLPDDLRSQAILAGLNKMQNMQADYLGAYANELHVKKEVFKTMTRCVNRSKSQQREENALKEAREEREASPVVSEDPKTKKLNDEFSAFFDYWYKQGLDHYESSIRAFRDLLKANAVIEGIQHYVVFKIPYEKGIRNDPRTIEYLNAHPSLRSDHGPARMTLNGRQWKGINPSA